MATGAFYYYITLLNWCKYSTPNLLICISQVLFMVICNRWGNYYTSVMASSEVLKIATDRCFYFFSIVCCDSCQNFTVFNAVTIIRELRLFICVLHVSCALLPTCHVNQEKIVYCAPKIVEIACRFSTSVNRLTVLSV